MIGTSSRVALASATAVLAFAGALGPAGPAAANGAPAADPAGAAAIDSAIDSAVGAYLASYPRMSAGQARSAALGQEKRKAIVVEMIARKDDAFGGAWFDPPTGILHVAATNASAVEQAELLARGGGVKLATHLVSRSFTELERRADALRGGEGALGQAAGGQVGIDVTTNTVTVALPAGQLSTMAASSAVPDGVTLVADSGRKAHPDAGCTSRIACDQTIRAGIRLWRTDTDLNNGCSVGFTARNASNQRILYTAGHCRGGASALWGTGNEFIGGQGIWQDSGAVDALVVNITEQWFIGDSGGEIYAQGAPGFSVPIKGVATTLSFIVPGETVCLSANVVDPNGSNHCATVELLSDPGNRGLVRVKGYDACEGDSGGGWYWIPATVNRHAYGIHSRSDEGCLGVGTTRHSWFTAVPTAKAALAPGFNVELRP